MWWVGGREIFQKLVGNRSGGILKCPSIAAALADVKSHQNLECNATKLLCVRSQNWLLVDYCQWCWHILKACCWWNFFLFDHILFSIYFTTARNSGRIDYTMAARWSCASQRGSLLVKLSYVCQEGVFETILGCGSLASVECQHGQKPLGEGLRDLGVPLVFLRQDVVQTPGLEFGYVPQFTWNGRKYIIRLSLTERSTQPLLVQLFRKISS